jgi:biopolymer transport protein ExbB
MSEMDRHMEDAASIELSGMESKLNILGIIAGVAPMLGFIGTISGVIKIFYKISLEDNISIGIISGGLYEKMITSGAGLIVGVLAYTFLHLLQGRIDGFLLKMQRQVLEFKNLLL